jgi:aspartyl-tRNA(Asn)/glutamyl-tRNA(Gln) amidotransferase subunit C
MALTPDEVRKIAVLARLRVDPEEEADLVQRLGEVVAYVERLSRVAPEIVGSDAGTSGDSDADPMPPDEADDLEGECLPSEAVAANAPAVQGGLVAVPAVLVAGGPPAGGAWEAGDG